MKLGFPIVVTAILGVSWSAGASPLPLHGVTGYADGFANDSVGGVNIQDFTGYNQFQAALPYATGGSAAAGAASDTTRISTTVRDGNVGLHGFIQSDVTAGGKSAYAWGGFDIFAYDTFTITGTPGTRAQYQFTLTLKGSASELSSNPLANSSGGELGLFINSSWVAPGTVMFNSSCADGGSNAFGQSSTDSFGNPCGGLFGAVQLDAQDGVYPSSGTDTATLSFAVGSTVEIAEYLYARTGANGPDYGGAAPSEGVFDVANTGWFTVKPLTPGAGYTTASGLPYTNSPEVAAVPEPGNLVLFGTGLLAVIGLRRRGA